MLGAVAAGLVTAACWMALMGSYDFMQEAPPSQKRQYAIGMIVSTLAFSAMLVVTMVLTGRAIVQGAS